jgi:DNA mismatch repair protein MutS
MSSAREPEPTTTLPRLDARGARAESEPRPSGRARAAARPRPIPLRSILFLGANGATRVRDVEEPACFPDLNLDQIVGAVVTPKRAYDLLPFFHAPLDDVEAIVFRQEVFADLQRPEVLAVATAFAGRELVSRYRSERRTTREDDGGFAHYHYARGFLNAVVAYCEAIEQLLAGLDAARVHSQALLGLQEYLATYVDGPDYRSLRDDARSLDAELDQVRYSLLLKGPRITVGPYDEQPDYSVQVSETFERFRQTDASTDSPEARDWDTFAALGVLHLVAKVYPKLFHRLDAFWGRYADYLDETVATVDRELQFYLSYLEYIAPLREAGLQFSCPRVSVEDKSEQALDTFDLALAAKRVHDKGTVVCNDIHLDGPERILVITGPNNGGKTTLARTIGQLHYLARLGCPVPGRDTRLFVCDRIITHFERREDMATLSGKLQDELRRLHDAMQTATPASLFVLNEMFNSTTARDALFLSQRILDGVCDLDALGVCVTFLDELTTLNDKTVSMVSTVDPDDPAIRTYELVRRPADGRAYARAVAEKYGLSYTQLTDGESP